MRVFVLDKNQKPLNPTHPARARKMLKSGRARVFKRFPFTIILPDVEGGETNDCQLNSVIGHGEETSPSLTLKTNQVFDIVSLPIRLISLGDCQFISTLTDHNQPHRFPDAHVFGTGYLYLYQSKGM